MRSAALVGQARTQAGPPPRSLHMSHFTAFFGSVLSSLWNSSPGAGPWPNSSHFHRLGFSVSPDGVLRAQNRGQYLPQPFHGQFARLGPWLAAHEDKLFDALGPHLVAFGEWCAARHSLDYATLPDWWMLFDVYDRQEQRFWSTPRRNAWAAEIGFTSVPRLYAGEVTLDQLRDWVHAHDSQFRQGHLEGIVVRRENADWLENRAKLVRADFTQTIEAHWKSRALEWNRVV